MSPSVERRLERLEALEEIRSLAARYGLAVDSRDLVALVALFVADVAVEDGTSGREALARWYDPVLRTFGASFHLTGNHVIDFVDDTHATGVVYCRPEHQVGEQWVTMPMQYWDRSERRDGRWLIKSRASMAFYAADALEYPLSRDDRFNFPGTP